MNKYFYKLMTPGHKIIGQDENGKPITWNVPHYSDMKFVYAKNEDIACSTIRQKLKRKWIGFRMFGDNWTKEVEKENEV